MILKIIITLMSLTSPNNEVLSCNVQSLEAHSFIQTSEQQEYVCVNHNDYTDFIIIEDENNSINLNDNLIIELNEYDEVVSQTVIK